jgi:hypothetical protein
MRKNIMARVDIRISDRDPKYCAFDCQFRHGGDIDCKCWLFNMYLRPVNDNDVFRCSSCLNKDDNPYFD